MPKNIDLLAKKLKSKKINTNYSSAIKNALFYFFNFKKDSVLKKISLSIDNGLKKKKKNFGIPFFLIKTFRNFIPRNFDDSYSKMYINRKSVDKELRIVIENLKKNNSFK